MTEDNEKAESFEKVKCKTCGDSREVPTKNSIGFGEQNLIMDKCPDCDGQPMSEQPESLRRTTIVPETTEQPNENKLIIETIQGLMTQVNEQVSKLGVLGATTEVTRERTALVGQMLEDVDLIQCTTLNEMAEGKAFE